MKASIPGFVINSQSILRVALVTLIVAASLWPQCARAEIVKLVCMFDDQVSVERLTLDMDRKIVVDYRMDNGTDWVDHNIPFDATESTLTFTLTRIGIKVIVTLDRSTLVLRQRIIGNGALAQCSFDRKQL